MVTMRSERELTSICASELVKHSRQIEREIERVIMHIRSTLVHVDIIDIITTRDHVRVGTVELV